MTRHRRGHSAARAGLAAMGIALVIGGFSHVTLGQKAPLSGGPRQVEQGKGTYSPYPDQHFSNRVFWGVAHIHTGYSFDAGMFGTTLTPDDLFKVARGSEVVVDNGQRFKLDRPLDWLAITDHAEYLGIADEIRAGSPDLLANPTGKKWYDMYKQGPEEGTKAGIGNPWTGPMPRRASATSR